ncbi:uncharacterized protein LOC106672333 [Cimex lectularius]|uniref:Uncharacterized protein n=1 Tax=Cimex lectularius TaxID=79782 RepID=A0A8I6S7I1_CIMLE|nr:uncharacterized protein LOC106672333 [Cimex lectularius]
MAGAPTPQTPVVTIGCRMLRSPSHESVTTDLSLFSVSSVSSDKKGLHFIRGPSPNPDIRPQRPADIPEILWFEEENEVIKSCGALSSALGLQKSFSTSDISQLPSPPGNPDHLRSAVSDIALSSAQKYSYMVGGGRLDASSRSCSTWVAVGDVTSQLPSPHGRPSAPHLALTPADLVRSVNKKVRQNYIRRRLLTTYKALERLSQSEFNLDRLEAVAAAAATTPSANRLSVPAPDSVIRSVGKHRGINLTLTLSDVERERGKPLSKYDRNMMIFNWLHTLDDAEAIPP